MKQWLVQNWFDLLQSAGIVAGLFFTGYSLRITARTQRITNLFQLTQYHRELWSLMLDRTALTRVRKPVVDLQAEPLTEEERLFVSLIILHLNLAYYAHTYDAIIPTEEVELDVGHFFSLPIPRSVWEQSAKYQNREFVHFVDQCLKNARQVSGDYRSERE